MRQNDVTIGGEYRVKVSGRLAPVVVTGKRERRVSLGRWQTVFEARTLDTGRTITASAARLRPVPGTPAAAAEQARHAKRAARAVTVAKALGKPAAYEPRLVAPSAVPGMVRRVDPSRLIEPLIGYNREAVERIVAGVHVSMPWSAACRAVYRVIGKGGKLRTFPKSLRRAAWLLVADEHARNRRLYVEAMGHAPIPSEEIVTAAMAGDTDARAAVLA